MTTAQRDVIPSPSNSELIFNTTTTCFEAYYNGIWIGLDCLNCQLPDPFSATTASNLAATTFDANWTASVGATTYYLDVSTVSTFASLVAGYNNLNVGNVLTHNITSITCGTTYYYRVRAGNNCGTGANSNTITATTSACPYLCGGTGTFVDARDGKTYGYVDIGTQRWMCQNLAYLPAVVAPATGSTSTAYRYVYGYSGTSVATAKATTNYDTYGVLYNWTAAMNGAAGSSSSPSGVQGACPAGWHLPSDAEWCTLENTIEAGTDAGCSVTGWRGANTGGDMKETGTANWDAPNTGATNTSGFTAFPGGDRTSGGSFALIGTNGLWWTTTEFSATIARRRDLYYTEARVSRVLDNKSQGLSIRCIQD